PCSSNLRRGSLSGTLGVLLLAAVGVCFASAPEAVVGAAVGAEPKVAGSAEVSALFVSLPDAPLPNLALMPRAAGSGSGDEAEGDLAVEPPASARWGMDAGGAVT